MRNYRLNRTLARIEREANDDLQLVLALGGQYFSTAELHFLLDQLEWRQLLATEEMKILYRNSIFIPVAFGFVFFFSFFDLFLPAMLAGVVLVVLSALLVWRSVAFHRRHPIFFQSRTIARLIYQELEHRRFRVDSRR